MKNIAFLGVCSILIFFSICFYGLKNVADRAHENRLKYSSEIREATKECLGSVRSNPQVQNFNDDNEVVETCTEYALKLYNADL